MKRWSPWEARRKTAQDRAVGAAIFILFIILGIVVYVMAGGF